MVPVDPKTKADPGTPNDPSVGNRVEPNQLLVPGRTGAGYQGGSEYTTPYD